MIDAQSFLEATDEQRQAAREAALNEAGTEPPCPFCHRPRVKRSDYIRCMRCGLNWTLGEQAIDRHPLATQPIAPTTTEPTDGAATAPATTDPPS
jgi:ribosomal protein L37AE/L43A